ncbi:MAG: hypothetical protein ABI210_02105, partial [Abditibacteriaceae bacterium]
MKNMQIKNIVNIIGLFSIIVIGNSSRCYGNTLGDKKQLIETIFNDPMLPGYIHGAKLSIDLEESDDPEESKDDTTNYIATTPNKIKIPGVFSVIHRRLSANGTDEVFALFDSPTGNEGSSQDINWDQMQKNWTAFVNRYWPSVHRTSDWQNEIYNYSGRGVFTMNYAQMEGDIAVLSVSIEVNLGDGKIRGFYETDYRNLLKGYVIPQAPSASDMLSATQKALSKKIPKKFRDFKIIDSGRDVKRFLPSNSSPSEAQGRSFAIIDSIFITVVDDKNNVFDIHSEYDTEKGIARIISIYLQPESNQSEEKSQRQKPLTQIDDKEPSWSADGKHLYFVTSRRAKDQPWWTPVAFQYALAVNQVGTDNLQYISPLKTNHGDYGLYQSPQISPDGHYLAAGLGTDDAYLFILDMQRGILHIPQRDPAFLVRQQKEMGLPDAYLRMTQSMFHSDGNIYPWISKGFQWLANGDFLYLGWLNGGGEQIFLARKVTDNTGQVWDVWPVYQKRGDDTLLCLSSDEKELSWAHQEPPPENTKDKKDAPKKPQPWQFVTADFDAAKPNVSNLNKIDLPDKPASISWDSKHKRWLIVTEKNGLIWIQKTDGKLTATKVLLPLTWNETKLH